MRIEKHETVKIKHIVAREIKMKCCCCFFFRLLLDRPELISNCSSQIELHYKIGSVKSINHWITFIFQLPKTSVQIDQEIDLDLTQHG